MNTLFTDFEAAVEEAHFIQMDLGKTCLLVTDEDDNMYVITDDQYELPKWKCHRVLEIFHRGGCDDGCPRILSKVK